MTTREKVSGESSDEVGGGLSLPQSPGAKLQVTKRICVAWLTVRLALAKESVRSAAEGTRLKPTVSFHSLRTLWDQKDLTYKAV